MSKLLLFGATGNLGYEIAKEAVRAGHEVSYVTRTTSEKLRALGAKEIIADVTKKETLAGLCNGYDVVLSSLGKSVSLNDKSRPSFIDVDLSANTNILEEAEKAQVKKFLYVSAMEAEKYPHLTYFKVHHDFSQKLINSKCNYIIIKPPAIFCAFIDLIYMARKGKLMNIGKGDKKTNPIYEGDLAKVCIQALDQKNVVIEAGGKHIYTRKQINEIIQNAAAPNKKARNMPDWLVSATLPFIDLFDKNMYDKFAFFLQVLRHDLIAPQVGEMKLEDYIKSKV